MVSQRQLKYENRFVVQSVLPPFQYIFLGKACDNSFLRIPSYKSRHLRPVLPSIHIATSWQLKTPLLTDLHHFVVKMGLLVCVSWYHVA